MTPVKPMNTAERLRESLGCYNIMKHVAPAPKKPKTVSYGAGLQAVFDAKKFTPERRAAHQKHLTHMAAKRGRSLAF